MCARVLLGPVFIGVWALIPAATARAQDQGALALETQKILGKHCSACHNNIRGEGGFKNVTDLKALVDETRVVPGKPDESDLLEKITSGEMPKKTDKRAPDPKKALPRPSAQEIARIRRWIESGAPEVPAAADPAVQTAKKRTRITDLNVLDIVREDLLDEKKVKRPDRKFMRYFSINHLHSAGLPGKARFSDAELEVYRQGLSKLINSLSWAKDLVPPLPVDEDGVVLRIDLRNYHWSQESWDFLIGHYPYGAVQAHVNYRPVYRETQCKLPVIRADWFVFAASKPPLYHQLLGLPGDDGKPGADLALEGATLKIDVQENLRSRQVVRAGFNGSGVSKNHYRMIERHDVPLTRGAYWKSYDFDGDEDEKNLFARPLGPGKGEFAFQHAGGEIIFNLPNGLQGYLLVKSDGTRLDKAPITIVQDPDQPDHSVVNGISCMGCHDKGIKPKTDQIRATFANLQSVAQDTRNLVFALYRPATEMTRLQSADEARFTRALAALRIPADQTEPISNLARRFEDDVDLTLAAAEASLKPDVFKDMLHENKEIERELSPLFEAGKTVKREVFVRAFPKIIDVAGLGAPLPFTPLPRPKDPNGAVAVDGFKLIAKSAGLTLKLIPKDEFMMGSDGSDPDAFDDEKNAEGKKHLVRITKPFYLGETEVTQAQYGKVMGANPSSFKNSPDHPVENVSWYDAVEFCNKLSVLEGLPEYYDRSDPNNPRVKALHGRGFRLPTEAEWEYACRGGSNESYSFGKDASLLKDFGWFGGNSGFTTHPVRQKKPNGFGLFDMHGNVWEWCNDLYDKDYYKSSPEDDPPGPKGNRAAVRVLRGGSWLNYPRNWRSANRNGYAPGNRHLDLGFRVAAGR